MTSRPFIGLFAVAIVLIASPGLAAVEVGPASAQPKVSSRVAAGIRDGLPTYAALQAASAAAAMAAVSSPVGTSAEGVTIMEAVVVEDRVSSRDSAAWLTKAAVSAGLFKAYPGASFKGQDPYASKTPNYAALMNRDDTRKARVTQVKLDLTGQNDAATRNQVRKEMYDAFIRRPTWLEEGMDQTVNRDRR